LLTKLLLIRTGNYIIMYEIKFKKKAIRKLQKLPKHDAELIIERISALSEDLTGDV
jgi:mRNA-degrading endonuclease RelE of RelBE toxin-antitoxin system